MTYQQIWPRDPAGRSQLLERAGLELGPDLRVSDGTYGYDISAQPSIAAAGLVLYAADTCDLPDWEARGPWLHRPLVAASYEQLRAHPDLPYRIADLALAHGESALKALASLTRSGLGADPIGAIAAVTAAHQ